MIAIVELILVVVCCLLAGRKILWSFKVSFPSLGLNWIASTAIGLGTLAYLILGVGLIGLLDFRGVGLAFGILIVFAVLGCPKAINDWRNRNSYQETIAASNTAPSNRSLKYICIVLMAVCGAIALLSCFVPPAGHEWDALSYHLAAPQIYLTHHKIVFLPTDHHSNFPFIIEMLFTVGLILNGFALSNLFHWLCGALTVCAMVTYGTKRIGGNAGFIAGSAFALTPIVIWEAGAAYIELGLTLFVLLSAFSVLEYKSDNNVRWLGLAGLFMGLALGTKALAIVPFVIIMGLLLAQKVKFKELRWYLFASILVGSPFYIKSWLWTGNPVYPFAYRVFGGKYWNTSLADAYSDSQKAFGMKEVRLTAGDDLAMIRPNGTNVSVVARVRNIVAAPFEMETVPRIYYDYFDPGFHNHLGFLWFALSGAGIVFYVSSRKRLRLDKNEVWLLALGSGWLLVWSISMQYVRYVIPMLPAFLLFGAVAVDQCSKRWKWVAPFVAIGLLIQLSSTLAYFGPLLPEKIARATSKEEQEKFLLRFINCYESQVWLNNNTSTSTGVVLFEEARGFYLKRPYLWGNELHSLFIPYNTFATGAEMAHWFLTPGQDKPDRYQYALVNLRFAPECVNIPDGPAKMVEAVKSGNIGGLFLEWYDPDRTNDERWRKLLGDAVRTGHAVIVNEASSRGTVVLKFLDNQPATAVMH